MDHKEFSDQFDTQINSYASELPYGKTADALIFNEYEKSVFLTEAENELVISLYNGNNTLFRESYDETEQLRKYLTNLVKTFKISDLSEYEETEEETPPYAFGHDANVTYYKITLPEDALFITWEGVMIADNNVQKFRDVVPVKYDEWLRISRNPFRQPNKKWRALRLDTGTRTMEIVSAVTAQSYHARYIKRPRPIVLVDLSNEGLSIEGVSTVSECELEEVLHPYILNLAIQKALASRALINK